MAPLLVWTRNRLGQPAPSLSTVMTFPPTNEARLLRELAMWAQCLLLRAREDLQYFFCARKQLVEPDDRNTMQTLALPFETAPLGIGIQLLADVAGNHEAPKRVGLQVPVNT